MIDPWYLLSVIGAMGLVTLGLRAVPFVAGRWLDKHPLVQRLGQFLPLAIMTLLLLNSTLGSARDDAHGPWPELACVAIVVVLQWWRRNALLSILLGTGLYVLIRNHLG